MRPVAFLMLVISGFCFFPSWDTVAAGSSVDVAFSGGAVLDGPVQVEVTVTPPVTTPGNSISLHIRLTNNEPVAISPSVLLSLPSNLTYSDSSLPAGVTYNYAGNTLTWQPILVSQDAIADIRLSLNVGAADLTSPEKEINLSVFLNGQEQKVTVPIWIGLPPQATIQIGADTISVGQQVQLTAINEGTGPFTQSWDFGDGRKITTPNPQIIFPTAGTYHITLLLSNPLAAVEATKTVNVINQPTAAFAMDGEKATPFEPVQFTNMSGGEQPLTYPLGFW